jgi:cytochrome oxidase assembly protein ShyY1
MQDSVALKKSVNLTQIKAFSQHVEWVQGRVHFLNKPIILLDNQRKGRLVGVTVYQLANNASQQTILLELGWLAVPANRTFPKPVALTGDYHVAGLMMPAPAAGFALGQSISVLDANTLLVTRLDIDALSKHLAQPLATRVLRLDPGLNIGFERTFSASTNTLSPEKHRAYAFQWFGLALAFLCLSLYVLKRKKS